MKKLFVFLLAIVLVLSFAACGKTEEPTVEPTVQPTSEPAAEPATEPVTEPEEQKPYVLRVGFGRSDITPTESVPLAGYGNTSMRMSTTVSDPLCSSCIAITDESDTTILIFNNDLISCNEAVIKPIRQSISKETGIPLDYIQVCATHTHSAPDTGNTSIEAQLRYNISLRQLLTDAALAALEDRAPAQVYFAETYPKNLNFVRHYLLSDGSGGGDNHGDFSTNSILQHASDADNQMQILKFAREGVKDILMVNWQSHPHRAGGSTKTNVTSDICGVMREYVEKELDCDFLYFTGGGGNINPSSRISSEVITADYKEQGKALGKYAVEAAANFQPLEAGPISLVTEKYTAKINHTTDKLISAAREIQLVWQNENNSAKCKEMGKPYDIDSPYEAGAIVTRAGLGEAGIIQQYAFAIGDIGFVTAPYEMFDTSGRQIKDNSPFKATFVMSCSNAGVGYLPTEYAFTYGCYEADTTKYVPGTAEALAQNYVKMLTGLYNTANGTDLAVPQTESHPMIPASTGSHPSDVIYYNYTRGQERTKIFDNFYSMDLVSVNGKTVIALNKEVCDAIDSADFLKLTFDDAGLAIAAEPVNLTKLPAGASVTAAENGSITLKAADGTEKTYKCTADLSSVLLTENNIGAGELEIGDVITPLTNEKGELAFAVITERHPVPFICPHCGEAITWTEWTSTSALPTTTGHYRLNVNVTVSAQASVAENADVVLDLHGHSADSASGARVYALFNNGCTLSVMDTSAAGTGVLRGHGRTDQGSVVWLRYSTCKFNLYSGTLDGSDVDTTMYGAALYAPAGSVVNQYGGTIIGGSVHVSEAKYQAASDTGKKSLGNGGSVFVCGKFNMYGGKITAGKANVYTAPDGTVIGGVGDTLLIGAPDLTKSEFHYEGGEIVGKVTLAHGSTTNYTGETETAP